MTGGTSTWTHRLGLALLPLSVAVAVVVVLRVILMVSGIASTNVVDVVGVLGLAMVAALGIRSGREYRRIAG